jgi:threonylcarbamoyladenosine tRNA methylthiotransferase CDKAL1
MKVPFRDALREGRDPLPNLAGMKVFFRSFGCALNQADNLRARELIKSQGGIMAEEGEAEAVVVHTCTVVKRTEREVLRFLRQHRNKTLVVLGCMAALQEEEIRSVCRPAFVAPSLVGMVPAPLEVRVNEATGLVPIARGCRGSCTYCMAKRARGNLQSETCEAITSAIRNLASSGILEIQLTAQDVSSWGLDRHSTLPRLISRLLSLPHRFRIRLGMMNPATLIPLADELLPLYRHENMYAFAHIPVQSGSDRMLEVMQRGYDARDFINLVRLLRENVPNMWIATDVIVGFPGETEEDFLDTLQLLERIRPNKVNITRFSSRPGTMAADLPDILERTKKERSRRISQLADRICMENNLPWVGRTVHAVVVERIKPGSVVCRTPQYRSVVLQEEIPLGTAGIARINGARTHYFTGTWSPGDLRSSSSRTATSAPVEEEAR